MDNSNLRWVARAALNAGVLNIFSFNRNKSATNNGFDYDQGLKANIHKGSTCPAEFIRNAFIDHTERKHHPNPKRPVQTGSEHETNNPSLNKR